MHDVIISGASQVLTCTPGAPDGIGLRTGHNVVIDDGRITEVRPARVGDDRRARRVIDASGRVVLPGFVDAHTHPVFAGDRGLEFAARAAGREPGPEATVGIWGTAVATRERSVDELVDLARPRLATMLAEGTTTAEAKSGYGLDPAAERRLLDAIRRLDAEGPIDLVATYLGAHAIPPDRSRADYVAEVVDTIPEIAAAGLATFVDVYVDEGFFTVDEAARVLGAGLDHGLGAKLHLDAYSRTEAAGLAIALGAASVDHANHTADADLRRLVDAGIPIVYLPSLELAVTHDRPLHAGHLVDLGATLAIATDCCAICPAPSMPLAIALACRMGGVSVEWAIHAATVGGARALGVGDEVGSLEPGRRADLLVLKTAHYADLAFGLGTGIVGTVIKEGQPVAGTG
jgi:imidazolonepropionase